MHPVQCRRQRRPLLYCFHPLHRRRDKQVQRQLGRTGIHPLHRRRDEQAQRRMKELAASRPLGPECDTAAAPSLPRPVRGQRIQDIVDEYDGKVKVEQAKDEEEDAVMKNEGIEEVRRTAPHKSEGTLPS